MTNLFVTLSTECFLRNLMFFFQAKSGGVREVHRRRQLLRADPGRGDREPAGEAARGLGEVQVGHQDHVLADGIRPGLARLARPHHGDALAQDRGDFRHGKMNVLTSEVG